MNLFAFYKISFLVSAFSGGALSQIGKHYYSRGKILEIFFLSQLALLGNLFSKLLNHSHLSIWSGIIFSYTLFGLGKFILYKKNIKNYKQGPLMIGGYLFLISLQYLIIGFFPQLDSHMSIGFFGNIVTASNTENILIVTTLFIFTVLYFLNKKSINKNTVEINLLGNKDDSKLELWLFSIPLVISLHILGFLYTMSFLLLPSLLLGTEFSSERNASIYLAFISILSAMLGLFLSIFFEKLSTTPVQVSLLFLILLICRIVKKNRLFD